MKVDELIEYLQSQPGDLEVMTWDDPHRAMILYPVSVGRLRRLHGVSVDFIAIDPDLREVPINFGPPQNN